MAHKAPDPCKKISCQLQKCLYETNYQMMRCRHILDQMTECCRLWREKAFTCEGFMWMFKDQFFTDTDTTGANTTAPDSSSSSDQSNDSKDYKE